MHWFEGRVLSASPSRSDRATAHPPRASGPARESGASARILLGLFLALASTACGPRYARVTLQDQGGLLVELRAETRGGKAVDRGFAHPARISRLRIANILSRIDVRMESGKEDTRKPAVPAEFLYDLGDLVSAALEKADSSQEVVVRAIRKERRLGIFSEAYLTSLVAYVLDDRLHVHLSRVDDALPKDSRDTIPEPWPNRQVMPFKVLASDGIVPVGAQAVAAAWRDPLFRSSGQIQVGPGGKVMRREILLESPEEEPESIEPETTGHLSPQTLRALADLEESRRRGVISEADYQKRRRSILASDPSAP
jgi:hypothetical protein